MWERLAQSAVLTAIVMASSVWAASSRPLVTMRVTLPDGTLAELNAPESGLAAIMLRDGTEIGFRPTIHDSKPWTRVVITIFRMPTARQASEEIGQVDVRVGGAAVQSSSIPVFTIAVPRVAEPPAAGT